MVGSSKNGGKEGAEGRNEVIGMVEKRGSRWAGL